MEFHPTIVLFIPGHGGPLGAQLPSDVEPGLRECGFVVRACRDLLRLPGGLAEAGAMACLVLDGTPNQNCQAASYVRTFEPGLGIVAMVPSLNENLLMQVLRSGADAYCPRGVTVMFLATVVSTVLRRAYPPDAREAAPGWSLEEQGWVLVCPGGLAVALTTGERAFLDALLNAPGMRASHGDLAAAVDAAYGVAAEGRGGRQLGLLVSRMRKKFHARGAVMPLRSVRGWGYMFAQGARLPRVVN
ncbi:MAG: helix-turn-helix domain-containing protein [Candidimonas sp.]|nr:MAG: helix-turn-helix domain-containing protein [Candidimonas sp.]